MSSIFTQIIQREVDADIVFENEKIIAIKDIDPVAPIHLLIIPKKEIVNIQSVANEDLPLIAEIIAIAQQLAREFGLDVDGYRLLTNYGPHSGQEIDHLHFHLIGGQRLGKIG